MCELCNQMGLNSGGFPFKAQSFHQGRISGNLHFVNNPATGAEWQKKNDDQAQTSAPEASGEQIDEAAMSSEGRDLLGLLRVSAAFGSTSEFTPVTVRFIGMLYGATPDDMATLQRYVSQNMKPPKVPVSDPGETIAQAVMAALGAFGG